MSNGNFFQSYETEAVIPPQMEVRANTIKLGMMKDVNVRRKKLTYNMF
jgi:hypothetical protein